MNDKTFRKRLQTVGKRLVERKSPSTPYTPICRYKSDGEVAYFTNGTVAIKFLNNLIPEDVLLKGVATPSTINSSFPNVEKLFNNVSCETIKLFKLNTKDLLSVIRQSKKDWDKGLSFGKDKQKIHFEEKESGSGLDLKLGLDKHCFNIDYRNLYEILLLMETVGDTELEIHFSEDTSKPILLTSKNIEGLIAPIVANPKFRSRF